MPVGAAIPVHAASATQAGVYAAYLADGETVILALKPSFWFVLIKRGGALSTLLCLWLLMAGIESLGWFDFQLTAVGLAFILIAVVLLLWLAIDRTTRLYLLTDKRILRVSGILTRTSVEIPLHKITTVALHRSFTERLTGVGSILFTSAAAGGEGAAGDLVWYMIDNPVAAVRTVRETLSRYGGGPTPPSNVGSFGAAQ